jgi:hypothetical protein
VAELIPNEKAPALITAEAFKLFYTREICS